MTEDSTFSKVVEFTAERLGYSAREIGPETRLCHDLGVGGDDGDEFMMAFVTRFRVDLKEFDSSIYFGSEGIEPIGCLVAIFNYIYWGEACTLRPLTIRMLCDAVDRGAWQEPQP